MRIFAPENSDALILYVHCAIEGYAKMAGYPDAQIIDLVTRCGYKVGFFNIADSH